MKKASALIWFRNDLRLADNPALLNAVSAYSYIVPVFVYSPEEEGNWSRGVAPVEELAAGGTKLGSNYLYPIVVHKIARQRALSAFKRMPQL